MFKYIEVEINMHKPLRQVAEELGIPCANLRYHASRGNFDTIQVKNNRGWGVMYFVNERQEKIIIDCFKPLFDYKQKMKLERKKPA